MGLTSESPRDLLGRELRKSEDEINLAKAALMIAQEEYPQLPVERYMARLDVLAEEVNDRLGGETAGPVVLQEVIHTLHERHGFLGNEESYHDPRNSFLNDVLDRSVGIPLTLSIVMLEVGWRLGLPLEGVNFPGRFLVRYRGEGQHLLIDTFDKGRLRFEDEAQEVLDKVYGGLVRTQPDFLKGATKRDMILRMLLNLKNLYINVKDDLRMLAVVERVLLIDPKMGGELRDRGMILARLGRKGEAVEQFKAYLDFSPGAEDVASVRGMIADLEREIPPGAEG
jgi:regulator of sirC expression with transglutaminase-like and TPR domain